MIWHIITDDIMEQMELKYFLTHLDHRCSIIPPDIQNLSEDSSICFIVNLNSSSFDAYSFLTLLNNANTPHSVIAYTSLKHDHDSILKAKSIGIQHVCTMTQLKDFLGKVHDTIQ